MRALVLATGSADGLAPLTTEIPAALVPVLDRPVMEHLVDHLRRQGVEEITCLAAGGAEAIAQHFADVRTVTDPAEIGDRGPAVVVTATTLTDSDLAALGAAHAAARAEVTVSADGGLWVAEAGALARLSGLSALSDLSPAAVLGIGAHLHVHEPDGHTVTVDSFESLRRAAFELAAGRFALPIEGTELDVGLRVGDGTSLDGVAMVEPPVWIGADVEIGMNARLRGPLVIGDGAAIGDGALLRDAVILPGATVPRETILAGGIAGHVGLADELRG